MNVLKFGGSSVSSKESIENIVAILKSKNQPYVVVVSAFSGVTNLLETIAIHSLSSKAKEEIEQLKTVHETMISTLFDASLQEKYLKKVNQVINEIETLSTGISIVKELTPKTQAHMLSFGERLSSYILYEYLLQENIDIQLLNPLDVVKVSGDYLHSSVDFEETNNAIQQHIQPTKNYIIGGFIGSNTNGDIQTLGRGGSDYTASILAAGLRADTLEIWSDVNGIHSANPKQVRDTQTITEITYEEAAELAYFGAKVIYPPTILPVRKLSIPIYLKNTFQPDHPGTIISSTVSTLNQSIQGVSSLSEKVIITVSGIGLAHQKGFARKVFQTLELVGVNIIMIIQSCSEQSIGMGIDAKEAKTAKKALEKSFAHDIQMGSIDPIKISENQSFIAVVGDNMKNKVGLSGKVFGALGENGININAIAQGSSERNITFAVDTKNENKALHVIHEKFFSQSIKNVHVFIAGIGNVGKEFVSILFSQKEKLIKEYHINLKIMGVSNSSTYLLTDTELSEHELNEIQSKGVSSNGINEFTEKVIASNLRNSIFVDNTASQEVSEVYKQLLSNSISVVTCNKIACSSSYELYNELNQIAKEHNCGFKYETSVGAALPVIKTIDDLLVSGDHVHKIEAVISGSLNFIFNEYGHGKTFNEVVQLAKQEGYTEPNPLIDLSGLDVMRKILILSREVGLKKELSDISFESFLPDSCLNAPSTEVLFDELEKHESHFKQLYDTAAKKGNKLKVVAEMEDEQLRVKLQEVPPDSPFYNLQGKDNVIALYTDRYKDEPMVIKGAGAGAAVTASGVFSDIMMIVNR